MKKIVSTLCAASLSFVLVACGGGGSGQEASSDDAATAEKTEVVEEKTDEKTDEKAKEDPAAKDDAKKDQSMLVSLVKSLDYKAGVHLGYHEICEETGTDVTVDSYVKGDSFFTRTTGTIAGYSGQNDATLTVDGKVYMIDEETMTATYVTTAMSGNQLLQDTLFQEIYTHANQKDYTVEEREFEGATFTVEVYEAPNAYQSGASFFFDQDGKLEICEKDAYSGQVDLPAKTFKAITFDTAVDDSLFDLSAYTVVE